MFHQIPDVLTGEDLEKMRESCSIAASTLKMIQHHIVPGVTTNDLNKIIHVWIIGKQAYPSPLNYGNPPFPKSVCTSTNHVACHGVPNDVPLEKGDIINVDVTCYYPLPSGFHGDTSRTFSVGDISPDDQKLIEVAEEAMYQGIRQVRPGASLWDIGTAIQAYTEAMGYHVLPHAYGHGIGSKFHAYPRVPHYAPDPDGPEAFSGDMINITLEEGMIFTVEPIVSKNPLKLTIDQGDKWSVIDVCDEKTAQFEHTVRVCKDGVDVLTSPTGF